MIDLIFQFGGEIVLIRIRGNNIQFGNTTYGPQLSTIEGIRLDEAGVTREYPDLKGDPNWKQEAIERFKLCIKELGTERAKAYYIIGDLKKHGYVLKRIEEAGKRPKKYGPS